VRLLSRRRTIMVWSSSSAGGARHGVQEIRRPARTGRFRWWLQTGALLTVIGLIRLTRTARTHLRPTISLAGTVITAVGISLPSEAVLVSGILVLLVALFLPSDRASAPARPCSGRLWAMPLTPFAPSEGTYHPPTDG
jgi:hypothetical protein